MLACCNNGQQYPELYLKEHCQWVKGSRPSSLLIAGEATCGGVLSSGLTSMSKLWMDWSSCSKIMLQHAQEAIPGTGALLQCPLAGCKGKAAGQPGANKSDLLLLPAGPMKGCWLDALFCSQLFEHICRLWWWETK